nr:MAG: replication polyprotein [Skomarfal virus 50]
MSRNRNWCFTLNNYSEIEFNKWCQWITAYCNFGIIGKEVGEGGTPHLQGYFERKNAVGFSVLKNFCGRSSFRVANGSGEDNFNYCSKEDKYWIHGEYKKKKPGKRTDLITLRDEVMSGLSIDNIALERPDMYHQYGRTLNKLEDLRMRNVYRNFMTLGTWLWGATGVGKSHIAFDGFTPSTHYVYPNDGGWWDGYVQQETVIINDFRGEIPYGFLLQLVDKWPVSVKRRNREPLPFMSRRIIVTSSMRPEDVYHGVIDRDDNIAQLIRRFEIVNVSSSVHSTEVLGGNTGTPSVISRPAASGHTVAFGSLQDKHELPSWHGIG